MFGIQWNKLPTFFRLLKLTGFRRDLRQTNLDSTYQLP